jgi:hypothetical protein
MFLRGSAALLLRVHQAAMRLQAVSQADPKPNPEWMNRVETTSTGSAMPYPRASELEQKLERAILHATGAPGIDMCVLRHSTIDVIGSGTDYGVSLRFAFVYRVKEGTPGEE